MPRLGRKTREEARRLFLTGEMRLNSEIATRLGVKPHTVAQWRKEEGWDALLLKIDRRAAEMFCDKIATDRVILNVRHYRSWELLLAQLAEDLKAQKQFSVRDLDRAAGPAGDRSGEHRSNRRNHVGPERGGKALPWP